MNTCSTCESSNIETLWKLPAFPLTGIFLDNNSRTDYQNEFDQALQFCNTCGHGELENKIDPTFLYRETYSHRTSESAISAQGNKFLQDFIARKIIGKDIKQVLEIGCNDLYLLKNVSFGNAKLAGIDPIWDDGVSNDGGINLLGGFAEDANYGLIIEEPIDLVISAHTFEHITSPRKALSKLTGMLAKGATFILEVPSAERMLDQLRLDQVFSQHVNYYSVSSLITLFAEFGFNLKDIEYNFGYWGGTQLLEFTLGPTTQPKHRAPEKLHDDYQKSIKLFNQSIETTKSQINSVVGDLVAYGAAQMLPVLAYHLGDEFSKVIYIIDDDIRRQGKYFPNLSVEIKPSSGIPDFSELNILLTALDSARPITKKLFSLSPRSIIFPIGII